MGAGRASHPAQAVSKSWREMPEEFGKWETAYRCYALWSKQGLWERILQALGEGSPGPTTKES